MISVATLGLIGVVAALMLTGSPLGFVAILGLIALVGMIIRNSVILVDQFERNRADGPALDPFVAFKFDAGDDRLGSFFRFPKGGRVEGCGSPGPLERARSANS